MNSSDLKSCGNTCRNESSGDEVLGNGSIEIKSSTGDCQGRGNDGSDHGQGML